MLRAIEAEHKRQKRMELDGLQLFIGDAGRMLRRGWKGAVLLLIVVGAIGAANPSKHETVVAGCGKVARVYLPALKYPHIADHAQDAMAGRTDNHRHWPTVLRINRDGADERRDYAVAKLPSRPDVDRDEFPPAMARTTKDADVRYVDDSENEGAGASMGNQLRGLPNGSCFRLVFKDRPR